MKMKQGCEDDDDDHVNIFSHLLSCCLLCCDTTFADEANHNNNKLCKNDCALCKQHRVEEDKKMISSFLLPACPWEKVRRRRYLHNIMLYLVFTLWNKKLVYFNATLFFCSLTNVFIVTTRVQCASFFEGYSWTFQRFFKRLGLWRSELL